MGNALRFLHGHRCKPAAAGDSDSLGPHGVSAATVGVSALAHDLFHFEITSQVPEGLGKHVVSSKKAQANWYRKLLEAWKKAKPPPKAPEEAARLVSQTLKRHQKADVEGLLAFYCLPLVQVSAGIPTSLPDGVKFEMQTLPFMLARPAPGSHLVFQGRFRWLLSRDLKLVQRGTMGGQMCIIKKLLKQDIGVINIQNDEILARKYRIRLRGIDAPESAMPYGKEAKEELANLVQGKCLRIFVYGEDRYGHCVGDIYSNGIFVQEIMLKKGLAWHYTAYDQRWELETWEKEARAKRVGLWASPNPEKPWEWRKDRRQGR